MIRHLTLLVIALTFSAWGFAQRFEGGLLSGLAATQVDGDGLGGYHRAGFIGGAWVSYPFSKSFALRMELKYIQKGSFKRFTDGAGVTIGSYSLRLNYTEVPFLAEYHFRDDLVPFAGLSFGYLWKSIEQNNGYDNPIEEDTRFKKFELAAHAGVEYKINRRFSFCFTASYSILPVRRHKGNLFYIWDLNFGQYNNVLQFYLRYHI